MKSIRLVLLGIFLAALPAAAQFLQLPANRIVKGTGAPASGGCDTAGEVGKVYIDQAQGDTTSPLYICANTGVGTYAWVASDSGGGGGSSGAPGQYCTVTYSATPVFDLSATSGGNTCGIFAITLTGNVTSFTITNPATSRAHFEIWWIQDGTGGRTVAGFPVTALGWCAPQIVASKITIQPANYDGTNYQAEACTDVAGAGTVASRVASGAKALATSAISSAACTSAQTATATGTLTTDSVMASFNGDPTAVTGYVPLTAGMLTIIVYPTADTVNFKVCNNTSGSITPGAITLNWQVIR